MIVGELAEAGRGPDDVWRLPMLKLSEDGGWSEHALEQSRQDHSVTDEDLRMSGAGLWSILWSTLHIVETIQIVIEADLLRATDRAARRRRLNRSALVREALRAHLQRLATAERERRDRAGYEKSPDAEFAIWDQVTAWPDE